MAVAPRQLKKLFCTKFLSEKSKSRRAWIIALVWSVGIVSMSALTIRDFIPLLSDYKNENVDTKVTVVKVGSVRRPNITLCIPYYSRALERIATWINEANKTECRVCEALADHGWDVWNDGTPFNHTFHAYTEADLATKMIKKLLLEEKDSDFQSLKLTKANFNWNQPLIDAVYAFFYAYQELDNIFLTNDEPVQPAIVDTDILGKIENPHIDELYQKLTNAFAIYLLADVDLEGPDYTSLHGRPVSFSQRSFCMVTKGRYEEQYRWYHPYNDPDKPPWNLYGRRALAEVLPDETGLFSPRSATDILYQTPENQVPSASTEMITIIYSITSTVVQRRDGVPCSPEPNRARCLTRTQAKVAIEQCGCQPLSYRYYLTNNATSIPYCTGRAYRACSNVLRRALTRSQDVCNNVCEYIVYDWKVDFSVDGTQSHQYFKLNFYPLPKPYTEFSVVTKTSPEMFVSQIGGVVNLYLGVDGLSICAALILLWDYVKKWRYAGKNQSKESSETTKGQPTSADEAWKEQIMKEMAKLREEITTLHEKKAKAREDNM